MTTAYTSLLGLALPVTGELSGTWGDVVNNYLTSYVDASVAGAQTISGSQTAVTLSTTNGSALVQAGGAGVTGSAQYQIINCTGNPSGLLTITAPASSKQYIVINSTSTSQSVKLVGAGPTTGVTIASSEKALIVWDGSDFVKVSSSLATGNVLGPASSTDNAIARFDGTTGKLIQNSAATVDDTTGDITAGKYNKVTITTPATGSTLTIANGKTLTANNSITLAGTDSTTMTFPSSNATLAALGLAQTFTATNTFSQINYTVNVVTVTSNAGTVPITYRLNNFTNSSASTMTITMATASAVDGQMSIVRIYDASAVQQTISWVNTENSTVSVPTVSNGSTTLPLTVGFMYNSLTSKWRCIASA